MNESSIPQRLLMIRLDRIGDLVLTLPVDESLRSLQPATRISWWIPPGLSFVSAAARPAREAREVARTTDIVGFFRLLQIVRAQRFDAAVIFHAPWWVSLLVWLARIPLRGGVKSQWHSFLFFNRAVRQKRSRAEASELEYNFRLVEASLGLSDGSLPRTSLKLSPSLDGAARDQLLARFGLTDLGYSVVHPGMGGSALNWPTTHYLTLIRRLAEHEHVVITGTKGDEAYLAPLREQLAESKRVIWLDGLLQGSELIAVLASARTITAPSTGVLHLAASTGRPTLGIFSPVRVQHPRRWGPQGDKVSSIHPAVDCPAGLTCLGTACAQHDCMAQLSPLDAYERLTNLAK